MYIVVDKHTKNIIHQNPAPLQQQLTPQQVYARFDPETMEIGAIDGPLPLHYKIENGNIIELTIQELADKGIVTLSQEQKIKDGRIVFKTISEQVADGMLKLKPGQKIIGEGESELIVEKTTDEKVAEGLIKPEPHQKVVGKGPESRLVDKYLSEQIKEGLLTLEPDQKIIGEGENEKVVEKTIAEQLEDGTIQLAPDQKVEGDTVVQKTIREQIDEGIKTLEEYKQERINHFSGEALRTRAAFLPDYKIQNAGLGMYDDAKTAAIKNTVQAFKDEFKRIKAAIESAPDLEAVEAVKAQFPETLVEQ